MQLQLSIVSYILLSCSLRDSVDAAGGKKKNPMKRLNDDCLRCICLASSECDPAVRCHSVGPVDYYCGPYQVSQRYWIEAGSPMADANNPFGK